MDTAALKRIAFLSMVIDHVGHFLYPGKMILRYIGRIAAPIFLFCSTEGLAHTKSKPRYIGRLYLYGLLMGICNYFFSDLFPSVQPLKCDIFVSLASVSLVCYLYEKADRNLKYFTLLMGYISFAIITAPIIAENNNYYTILTALTCNFITCEYGVVYVITGFLLYQCHGNKKYVTIVLLLSGLYYLTRWVKSVDLTTDYQWLMVAAIPFILLYNRQRGKYNKNFYYFTYPLHIYVLYCISAFQQKI